MANFFLKSKKKNHPHFFFDKNFLEKVKNFLKKLIFFSQVEKKYPQFFFDKNFLEKVRNFSSKSWKKSGGNKKP